MKVLTLDDYLVALGRVVLDACAELRTERRQQRFCERLGLSAADAMALMRFCQLSHAPLTEEKQQQLAALRAILGDIVFTLTRWPEGYRRGD